MGEKDEIERLKFELRQAIIDYGSACKSGTGDINEITTRAVARIDALGALALENQRDAARYRRMRDGDDESVIDSVYQFSLWENSVWLKRGAQLDSAVDSANSSTEG